MEFEYKPYLCFVFPVYKDSRCCGGEGKRTDFLIKIYRKISDSKDQGFGIAIEELIPHKAPNDLEKINSEFSKIFCNFELLINFYGFLTYVRKEIFEDLAVEIFEFLIFRRIELIPNESVDENNRKEDEIYRVEIFERIWEEFKNYYYSKDLEDLL